MKMKNRILTIVVFALISFSATSQEDNFYYENAVYNENIKTVLMYREGFNLSNPVIGLNEEVSLVFKFDDFSKETKDYYYTIIHCDANWNESFLIQEDYLNGFIENRMNDYENSFNTIFEYVNYRLFLPNEDVQLKLSGNYALVVYEDNDKEKIVISQRFYVVEALVELKGTVRRATLDAFKGENQEIDFTIYHDKLQIDNPREEVKVVIMQNNRWDNAIRDLKPLFIKDKALEYDYNRENVFKAGNEFRCFCWHSNL